MKKNLLLVGLLSASGLLTLTGCNAKTVKVTFTDLDNVTVTPFGSQETISSGKEFTYNVGQRVTYSITTQNPNCLNGSFVSFKNENLIECNVDYLYTIDSSSSYTKAKIEIVVPNFDVSVSLYSVPDSSILKDQGILYLINGSNASVVGYTMDVNPFKTNHVLTIPSSIPTSGGGATYDVTEIKSYAFYQDNYDADDSAPDGINHLIQEIKIGKNVESIHSYAFYNFREATKITFDNDTTPKLKHIGSYAFSNCFRTDIVNYIPKSVMYVGEYAFDNDDNYHGQSSPTIYLDKDCNTDFWDKDWNQGFTVKDYTPA